MLFARLLKQKCLLNSQSYNNFKKNLYNKVNPVYSIDFTNDFKNEFINIYINKKQLKITNSTCCKYCKGTGWIIWKTNKNLHELDPMFSYSLCYKCTNSKIE